MFDEALQSNTEMQKKEREGTTGRNTERNAEYSPRLREEKYRTVFYNKAKDKNTETEEEKEHLEKIWTDIQFRF